MIKKTTIALVLFPGCKLFLQKTDFKFKEVHSVLAVHVL